jgi:hypothetical protein
MNISIRNNGFKDSGEAKLIISVGEKSVKEMNLDSLKIGHGRKIILNNVWSPEISVEELEFFIDSNFKELEKNNNRISLEMKK